MEKSCFLLKIFNFPYFKTIPSTSKLDELVDRVMGNRFKTIFQGFEE